MENKNFLVAGCGVSGIGAAKMLIDAGEPVVLYDSDPKKDRADILSRFPGTGPELVLGELPDRLVSWADICVISPGIPTDAPFAVRLTQAGVPLWSEIELAWHYEKGTVIGITGTNGKTTTTSLAGEMIRAGFGGEKTFVVGNIGTAYTGKVLQTAPDTVTVAEISSFQLETAHTFHPHVSAILNITPDHLNRHKTMENYIAVKESITKNQTAEDYCVLNYDVPVLRDFGENHCPAAVIWFSSRTELKEGFFMRGDEILYRFRGQEGSLGKTSEFLLIGRINYENIMAASACAMAMGVPAGTVSRAAKNFHAVEHRIEYTTTKRGVKYYNDSKGTNPDAAIQAIRAMDRDICLIGGGFDKGSEYDEWVEEFGSRVKYLVLIGQTREKIAECCRRHGFTAYEFADNMEQAVQMCAAHAKPGMAVLLSPACASWGMFDNYEQRGRIFKDLARKLPD